MKNDKDIKPYAAGVIYGEITHWLIIAGSIIAIIGSVMYFAAGGFVNKQMLITDMWQSTGPMSLWKTCSCNNSSFSPRWYLTWLPRGDAIAMVGIAVACLAGVVGMWGALIGTIRSKNLIYIGFALLTVVILTLSAIGIIKVNFS